MPLENQFWGDSYGQLRDPFGYTWSISQTVSAPTPPEMENGVLKALSNRPEAHNICTSVSSCAILCFSRAEDFLHQM